MSTYTDTSFTSDDGLRLYARDYPASGGPAPVPAHLPVVCLHGLTRNSADFDELAPEIARWGRRVLVPADPVVVVVMPMFVVVSGVVVRVVRHGCSRSMTGSGAGAAAGR